MFSGRKDFFHVADATLDNKALLSIQKYVTQASSLNGANSPKKASGVRERRKQLKQ
jgi:hypothetical protein